LLQRQQHLGVIRASTAARADTASIAERAAAAISSHWVVVILASAYRTAGTRSGPWTGW
jgi:hypothetical protein